MNTAVATTERNAFEQYSEAANQNKIVGDLLKFSKGKWYAGQDEEEVAIGTKLVANMDEAMAGWVKWEGGKPTDMQMGRIAEAFVPPRRNDLGDDDKALWEKDDQGQPRDPWQFTNYVILKDASAPADEGLYTFATSSKGGLNAIGRLCGAFGKHMRAHPDEFPIVVLGVDDYKHPNKTYGRIYVPLLDVEGWEKRSVFDETEGAAERQQAAPKPGRKSSAAGAQTQF